MTHYRGPRELGVLLGVFNSPLGSLYIVAMCVSEFHRDCRSIGEFGGGVGLVKIGLLTLELILASQGHFPPGMPGFLDCNWWLPCWWPLYCFQDQIIPWDA